MIQTIADTAIKKASPIFFFIKVSFPANLFPAFPNRFETAWPPHRTMPAAMITDTCTGPHKRPKARPSSHSAQSMPGAVPAPALSCSLVSAAEAVCFTVFRKTSFFIIKRTKTSTKPAAAPARCALIIPSDPAPKPRSSSIVKGNIPTPVRASSQTTGLGVLP